MRKAMEAAEQRREEKLQKQEEEKLQKAMEEAKIMRIKM